MVTEGKINILNCSKIKAVCKYIIYTWENHSAKKKEILLFDTTWIDLEGIMLNEVSQTEKDKDLWSHWCVVSKKKQQPKSLYSQIQKTGWWYPEVEGSVGEMDEGGQKLQTSNNKNK